VALLLTDITLPNGVDGRALAKEAQQTNPGLRVLYMSGYSENAVAGGRRVDAHIRLLEKPFNTADLAKQVRAALSDPPQL
jgi:DNA-binding NtrC family response regulator